MATDDETPSPPPDEAAGWIMTFADLMSLLMCFFVLLLSFSEMDLAKFKQVAGSMERAFGVQRVVKAKEPPRGTSIIAQEFSPGKPEPTPINEVRQHTIDEMEEYLKIEQKQKELDILEQAQAIAEQFTEELGSGEVDIETEQDRIVIRINEKGSFPSGSATLRSTFLPTLKKIGDMLVSIEGKIEITGHTDDIPISNGLFNSNWELSAARASSVITALLRNPRLDQKRFVLRGYASNKSLLPNNSPQNRARNRRVELIITQGEEEETSEVLKIEDDAQFEISVPAHKQDPFSTFPPATIVTEPQGEEDLGLFVEEAVYEYEEDKLKALEEGKTVTIEGFQPGETLQNQIEEINESEELSSDVIGLDNLIQLELPAEGEAAGGVESALGIDAETPVETSISSPAE